MYNLFANLIKVFNGCLFLFFLSPLQLLIGIALINIVCTHEIIFAMNLLFNVILDVFYLLFWCNHSFSFNFCSFCGSSVEGDDVDEDRAVEFN